MDALTGAFGQKRNTRPEAWWGSVLTIRAARVSVLCKPLENIVAGFRRVSEDSRNNMIDRKIGPTCTQLSGNATGLCLVAAVVIGNGEEKKNTSPCCSKSGR